MNELLIEKVKAIPDIDKEDVGKYYYSTCPCGGRLTSIRSVNGGYLHVKCDKCGFELHE